MDFTMSSSEGRISESLPYHQKLHFGKKNKMKQKHFRLCLQDVRVPLPLSIHFPSSFYQIQFVWEENVPRSEQRIDLFVHGFCLSLDFVIFLNVLKLLEIRRLPFGLVNLLL